MTATDPATRIATDQAIISLGRLREAWPWLADAAVPGPTAWTERPLSDDARAALDRLVAAERGDRIQLARDKLTPAPATAAPARIAPLDARAAILALADEIAWRITNDLRRRMRPGQLGPTLTYRQTGTTTDQRAQAALDYLAVGLRAVDRLVTADHARRTLDAADRLARAAAGAGPDTRLLKAECPACGRRAALRADIGSPNQNEWGITCIAPGCRCRGIGCPCNQPSRYPGARHIWPHREWEQLGRLLDRQEPVARLIA